MSAELICIASLIEDLLADRSLLGFVDRVATEDQLQGAMLVLMGAAPIIKFLPALLTLVRGLPLSTKSMDVDHAESLCNVWDKMEARGIPWLYNNFKLPGNIAACSFWFCGDQLCADVELILVSKGLPPRPVKGESAFGRLSL